MDDRHEAFRLGPGGLAVAPAGKDVVLMCYGVHAFYVEVPSFVDVGGSIFAAAWAAVVFGVSTVDLAAVARSWFTGKTNFERWATAAFILTMLTYSIVLVVRGILLGNWSGVSLAWIPVALVILSTVRFYSLTPRRRFRFRRRVRAA